MPVSHVGLSVSHLPSACSFFLSALQPLGYRYIGKQDDQAGFGVEDADFFLSSEFAGIKPTTAHVAFSAPSRIAVRDFYTAALNAGGKPNGAPASRGEDDCLFNAAVLDLDGNSIEVIHREDADADDAKSHYSGHSRVLTWRQGVDDSGTVVNDAATTLSVPKSNGKLLSSASSVISSISKASKAPTSVSKALTSVSRTPTSVSKSPTVVSKAPTAASKAPSTARSVSTPILPTQSSTSESSSGITTKGLIGTLLGAAAGAAVAYAMVQSERDSARQELEFEADMTIRTRASPSSQKSATIRESPVSEKGMTVRNPSPQPSRRNFSTTESEAPASYAHRNFSVTESAYSTPYRARTQLALDRAPEPQHLEEVDAATYYSPTYVSLAPSQGPPRSALSRRDEGPISEAPVSEASGVVYATISYNSRRPAFSGRSVTAPVGPRDEPPSPRQVEDVASQARQAEEQWAEEDMVVARRDSAMSMGGASDRSHKSRHSSHRDSERSSRHSDVSKRSHHDSSRSTHRSHRHRDDSPSRESHTSTIKPSRAHSAADVALPGSRKTSVVSARDVELPSSRKTSVVSARDVEIPASRKTSVVSARNVDLPASRMTSVVSARDVELPSSRKTSVVSAREVELPASRKTSVAPSMTSTAKVPLPESRAGSLVGSILGRSNRYFHGDSPAPSAANIALPDHNDDDDDVFLKAPDTETVLPSDSISCVGGRAEDEEAERGSRASRRDRERSRSRESRKSKHSSHSHRSKHRSEAGSTSTVKPAKRSVASLPVRQKESEAKSKRSVVSAVLGR